MKHKRFLSWILIFALLFGPFSVPVYAEGNTTTITQDTPNQQGTMTITLKIKGTPDAPAAPEAASTTKNSITLKTVSGCEYKLGDGNWQNSTEFTGLLPGTEYMFYQRLKATDDNNASDASSANIRTEADTYAMTITLVIKSSQTITAEDVTATYGDIGKSVSATTSGNGAISYAVKEGSGDYISVDSNGKLNIKKVPTTDGKAYVIVTAGETDDYAEATKEVTVTISKANQTITATVLPAQNEESYAVSVALPAGDNSSRYEYAITEGATSTLQDTPAWKQLPAIKNGQFYPDGLASGETYKIWLRMKGDANHNASNIISKTFTTPAKVMLAYDANGGSGKLPEAKLYDKGSTTDRIDDGKGISRYGYSFNEWTITKDGGTSYNGGAAGFQINSSTVLYAQWTQNIYTVKFDPNGGTGTMANQAFTFDASATALANNNFMKEGSTFAGWALKPDGEVVYKNGQAVRNLAPSGTVTLYAVWVENTYSITGIVKNETDNNPVSGVNVKLVRSGVQYGTEQTTGETGAYAFTGVPAGTYNIIAEKGTSGNNDHRKMTALVEVKSNKTVDDITLPGARVNSVVQVEANTPAVMVGELDEVAKDEKEEGKEVTVTMTVETKSETQAEGAATIKALAETDSSAGDNVEVDYLDIKVEKKVEGEQNATAISETGHVIEMIVPFNFANRKNCELFRYHDGIAQKFTALNARPTANLNDATFYADRANSRMYVYGSRFSTYAISFETAHKVTVTFRKNDGTEAQETQEIELGTETPLTANSFTRSGYSFSGWNTEANGSGTSYANSAKVTLDRDLVLYAQWRANSSGKTSQSKPVAPTIDSKTTDSITVKTVANQEYSIDNGKTWKSSGTFTGLTPDTEYSIVTRKKATSQYYASPKSDPLVVKTDAEEVQHVHELKHVVAKEATCVEDGNKEYWECTTCEKLFADKDAETETTIEEITIDKSEGKHTLKAHEAVEATCLEDGCKAYWECTACKKLFADKEAKTETTMKELVIDKSEGKHELTAHEAKEATCTEDGNKAYWECTACKKLFEDADAKKEIKLADTVIKAEGHKLTHVAAKEAKVEEEGNIEYWYCETCKKYFADAEGKKEIDEKSIVIPPLGKEAISDAKIEVSASSVYNGKAQTPKVTVKLGDKTLVEGTDYDITYSDNMNAGTAKVTVKAKGSYYGEATGTFTIAKKVITLGEMKFENKYYDGSKYMKLTSVYPKVTGVLSGDEVTVKAKLSRYVVTGTKSPGNKQRKLTIRQFTLTGKDAANYKLTKGTMVYGVIKKVPVKKVTLKNTSVKYNGKSQKPVITGITGPESKKILLKNCTVTYTRDGKATKDFKSKGTIVVKVTGTGFWKGSVSVKYVIK